VEEVIVIAEKVVDAAAAFADGQIEEGISKSFEVLDYAPTVV
jgi:hypothetical protein